MKIKLCGNMIVDIDKLVCVWEGFLLFDNGKMLPITDAQASQLWSAIKLREKMRIE